MKKMTRGQAGPGGGHISWGSACGLHSQKHTRTDSGWIPPWPFTFTGLPLGQQRPCCHLCRSQQLDRWTHPQGRGCACVCMFFCERRLGGRGSLGKWISHLVQPPAPSLTELASLRPKGQLSPFSRISLSLLAIFLPPPPLSSEVNKELFQNDVRNRGGCFVCICI